MLGFPGRCSGALLCGEMSAGSWKGQLSSGCTAQILTDCLGWGGHGEAPMGRLHNHLFRPFSLG